MTRRCYRACVVSLCLWTSIVILSRERLISSCFLSNVGKCLGSICARPRVVRIPQTIQIGDAMAESALETTLDRLSSSNCDQMKVVLRRVYHMTKDITAPGKSPLWKCIVCMVDKKANGVYLEFRSYKGKADLEKQAKMCCENKFVVVQGLLLSQNNKFLGGFCADMSNRASKVKVHPMAESHQTAMDMAKVVPTPQSDLATLKQHCRDYQRADLIGLVMSKNIPQTKTVSKAEVWMKDESEMELLVNLWGPKYTAEVRDNVEVGMVLQLENCLLSKKEDGSVEASCQDWLENDRHQFARMMVDPKSDRAEVLKLLSPDRGQQISTPWAGVGTVRLTTDGSPKIVSCAATVNTCSLALTDAFQNVPWQKYAVVRLPPCTLCTDVYTSVYNLGS